MKPTNHHPILESEPLEHMDFITEIGMEREGINNAQEPDKLMWKTTVRSPREFGEDVDNR
jgi:hypothetical protein